FAAPTDYPVGGGPFSVVVGDFNHDGRLDIAAASSITDQVSVLLANASGGFQPFVGYPVGADPDSIAVGDLNHDGNLDLVSYNPLSGSVSVLLGTASGVFHPAVNYATGGGANFGTIELADVNRDGNLDAITTDSPSGYVSVLLGNGSGGFASPI